MNPRLSSIRGRPRPRFFDFGGARSNNFIAWRIEDAPEGAFTGGLFRFVRESRDVRRVLTRVVFLFFAAMTEIIVCRGGNSYSRGARGMRMRGGSLERLRLSGEWSGGSIADLLDLERCARAISIFAPFDRSSRAWSGEFPAGGSSVSLPRSIVFLTIPPPLSSLTRIVERARIRTVCVMIYSASVE